MEMALAIETIPKKRRIVAEKPRAKPLSKQQLKSRAKLQNNLMQAKTTMFVGIPTMEQTTKTSMNFTQIVEKPTTIPTRCVRDMPITSGINYDNTSFSLYDDISLSYISLSSDISSDTSLDTIIDEFITKEITNSKKRSLKNKQIGKPISQLTDKNSQYICPYCGVIFAYPATFDRHVKSHSTNQPYKCDQCSLTFARQSNLDQHHKIHPECTNYISTVAIGSGPVMTTLLIPPEVYPINPQRKLLIPPEVDLNTSRKLLKCDQCSSTFTTKIGLTRHLKNHNSTNYQYQSKNNIEDGPSVCDCHECAVGIKIDITCDNEIYNNSHTNLKRKRNELYR
jgi:predicted RNA-binding Zn-ribbon protein involved in translation (DUF1610 family)